MEPSSQHNAYDHPQDNSRQTNPNQKIRESADRQWITLPEGLKHSLTKRVEFSLPVWILAAAAVILALLIFD